MQSIGDWLLGRFATRLTRIERNNAAAFAAINRRLDNMGSKEDAALAKLDDLLDQGDATLTKLQEWQAAEDEDDATAIQERVTRLQKQQEDLNALAGVSTTVNPSQPIDAVTGQNVVAPEEPSSSPDEESDGS